MIAFERLVDWLVGELDAQAEDDVEEHIIACDECAATARLLLELRESVPEIARAGQARYLLTRALLRKIEADALPVRTYVIAPGATVPCSADSRQVYALTHLQADLEDVVRVDAELLDAEGATIQRIEDAPFDRRVGAVVIAETGDAVRQWPTMLLQVRLMGRADDGSERELGVYRLDHTGRP